jgi:DNA-binding response OmpR family regulator
VNKADAIPRQKKLRIVLVDDEWHMLQLLEMYIREWFNEVEVSRFQNGDPAWTELSQTEPDLLITDWRHPGLDGGELVKKLAETKSKIPVLMVSASDTNCISELAGLNVKISYLQKPFGVKKFWQLLDELVGPCDHPPRLPNFP